MREPAVVPAQFPALTATLDGSPHADLLPVGSDRESARAAGFAAGFAAGARAAARAAEVSRRRTVLEREAAAREADERTSAALEVLAAAARAATERTVPVLAEAEHAVHEAALSLAAAVLAVELRSDETSAAAVLARVRQASALADAVTVRLNPDDLALLSGKALPTDVVLVADPALGRGEAVATHPDGWLDGRIDAALARARAALEGPS